MYKFEDELITDQEAQEGAASFGLTVEEWSKKYGWEFVEGKETAPGESNPNPGANTTSGESSSEDFLSESSANNPYHLTLEDLEGSDTDVQNRVRRKLRAIGIKIDEAIPGLDAINLQSLTSKDINGYARTLQVREDLFGPGEFMSESNLKKINDFIDEFGDDTYAESLKEITTKDGKTLGNLQEEQNKLIASQTATKEEGKEWIKSQWLDKEQSVRNAKMQTRTLDQRSAAFTMGEELNKPVELDRKSFGTDEEYQEYLSWKKSGEVNVSEDRLEELRVSALADKRSKVSKAYSRDLSDQDRENIETIAQFEARKIEQQAKALGQRYEDLKTSRAQLEKDIASFNENPQDEAAFKALKKREGEYLVAQAKLLQDSEVYKEFIDKDETRALVQAADDLSLDYSLLKNLGVSFKKTAIDLGYGAYQLVSVVGAAFTASDVTVGENVEAAVKRSEEKFKDILSESAAESARFDTGVAFDDIFEGGNVASNLVSWAGHTTVQAVPSLTLAFTGPAAMPLFFLSGYGSTAAENAVQEYEAIERIQENKKIITLNEEYSNEVARLLSSGMSVEDAEAQAIGFINEKYKDNADMRDVNFIVTAEEKSAIEKQLDADAEIVNIPAWKEISMAAVAGTAEVLFERLGTVAILKGANAAVSAAPTKREILKSILKSANQEGLTEAATELTNNFAKMTIMGEDINIFDNVAESYFGGVLIGGPLELKSAAPAVYAHIAHESMSSREIKEYRSKIQELGKLVGQENLETLLNPNIPLPQVYPKETQDLIKEIQSEGELIQDAAVERLGNNLTIEQIQELGEINMRMRQINTRLLTSLQNSTSQAQATATAESLRKKFDKLSDQREALLGDLTTQQKTKLGKENLRGSLMFETASQLVSENQLELRKQNALKEFDKLSAEEIAQKTAEAGGDLEVARENYFVEKNKKALEEDYTRAQSLMKNNGLNGSIESLSDEEFKKKYPAEHKDQVDGFYDPKTGNVVVNIDSAAQKGKVGTFTHEVFHSIIKETVGNGTANKAGKEMLEFLRNNDSEAFAYIENHLAVNYTRDGVKDGAYYEEALTALSDYLTEGNTVQLNTVNKINSFFNKVFGNVSEGLSISNGAKTFEFMVQYANKNRGAEAQAALDNFIKQDKAPVDPKEDVQGKIKSRTLTPEQSTEVAELLAKRNERKAQSEEVAKKFGVEAQADAVQLRLETRIREALAPVIGKIVTNRTKALYDPIPADAKANVSRDEFQESLRTEVEALAFEEYKDGKQDIEKFLVNRAFLRANNLASRLGIESAESGGIKQDVTETKGLTTEAETTTQQAEAPTYTGLTQSKTVSKEAKTKIKDKLKTVVRTQTARMDLVEGKNVSVRKYIKNIRDGVGNLAWDIIREDAMYSENAKGKMALDQAKVRKFLAEKGLFIAQNLTTTTLQVKMPQLVQKKLAETGEFVSYPAWVGKKIARASVESKGREGKTSGDFEVRRLPDAQMRAQAKIDGVPVKNLNVAQLAVLQYMFENVGVNAAGNVEVSGLKRANPKALAKDLAAEAAFEILNEELQNPDSEVRKAFENNQEGLGVALTENFVTEVARDAERGSVKYSRTVRLAFGTKGNVNTQKLAAWEAGKIDLSTRLHAVGSDISEKAIKQELKAVYGDLFTTAQYNALAKELKGIFKNVQNAGIEVAQVTAGEFLDVLENLSNDIDFNDNIHKLVGAKAKVTELYRDKNQILEAKASIVEILTKLNVPANIAKSFIRDTFANSGRTGVFYKDGSRHPKNQTRQDLFFDMADVEASLVGEGKLYSREEWDNADRVNKSTSVTKGFRTGKFDQAADAASAKAAWDLTTDIVKSLKSYSPEVQAMVMAAMNSGTSTVLRQAAPVTHTVEGFSSTTASDWRYEHLVPARLVLSMMYQYHVKGDKSINIEALEKDYAVAIIPKIMDDIVRDAGLEQRQIIGYKPGEVSPWKRYYNIFTRGAIQFAVTSVVDGKKIGEDYARAHKAKEGFGINSKEFSEAVARVKEIESKPDRKLSRNKRTERSQIFNEIIERKTGVEEFKSFSAVQAQFRGRKKGKFKFFVAPAVDDFRGLVNYAFAGKGKQGEKDMQWLEDNLMTPYAKGIAAIDGVRQQIKRDWKAVVKQFPKEYKMLNKTVPGSNLTYDHAVRVYLWTRAGVTDIPGLSKKDTKVLQDAIQQNPELIEFAEAALVVARRTEWIEPTAHWVGGTLLSDLNGMTEKIGRKHYLEEFITNAEEIFTEENLNKIEAVYGSKHREAIEDALYAMINGTNRQEGTSNRYVNAWLNWINGSTGAIMFFNRRSALLQMLSTVNFVNYSDNNPVKAARAFANQKQYWADVAMLFNSDKLKERRGGLKQDVNTDELASVANESKNSPQAMLAYLLKVGFTPTQIADSLAIATGGATFYRNRVNTYIKKGMSVQEAEQAAFLDFSKISDETQQSSDPALVSQVQRSVLGRMIFAFQNTPMQLTRKMKKEFLDLANGRGVWYEKVSRIAYYGMVQNFVFNALQNALFSMLPGFDDDDEELTAEELEKKNKKEEARVARALNGMLDTVLRGSGIYGAVISTIKNIVLEYKKQDEAGFMADHTYTILKLFDISPPIGSKARKVYSAIQTKRFDKDEIEARGWAVAAEGRLNLGPNWSILGNVVSATLNLPLDRAVAELTSVSEAMNAKHETWQRIAMALGWKTWDVGVKDEVGERIKEAAKARRKAEGIEKAKETRARNKQKEEERVANLSPAEKAKEEAAKEEAKEIKRKERDAKRQIVIDDHTIVDEEALYDLTRAQQEMVLNDLELPSFKFAELKSEADRVNKIIELRNKLK